MKSYIKLLRVKHYIKNILIFMPMFFAGNIFNLDLLRQGILGFVTFCVVSSGIYILNDIKDIEKDRKHVTKRERPLASGKVKVRTAIIIMLFCWSIAIALSIFIGKIWASILLILYIVLNIAYSMGLKNKPIIDIVILASGFVIRIFYGGMITEIDISQWMYLVVVTGSLYMGLGKRRNELKTSTDTREVLKYYNVDFLDKNMYVCVALADVFYALWTLEMPDGRMAWTIPIFIILLMCYSLNAEGKSDGDPVEVILHDKVLLGVILAYAICVFALLYIFR